MTSDDLSPEMRAAARLGYLPAGHRSAGSAQTPLDIDWEHGLRRNSNGCPYGDESNILYALRHAPLLCGAARFNAFSNRVEVACDVFWRTDAVGTAWTDDDDLDVMAFLQRKNIPVRSKAAVGDSIQRVAKDAPYHPVREYLDSLTWDGTPRLEHWLREYLGADADPNYLAPVGKKFLISAVARVYEPGCQADHVLVLEGRQGVGKTQTMRVLGDPWTTDSVPDVHSKDAAIQLQGVWLVELAELAALRKAAIEATKAFITRRTDRYRPPYGKRTVEIPRQCVFVGTTNEANYLRDPTGNRRFWPVKVMHVELDALRADRAQLWAEAVTLFRKSVPWHLSPADAELAAQEQDLRRYRSEIEQQVAGYLGTLKANEIHEVTTRDVFTEALGLKFPQDTLRSTQVGAQIANAITNCGWIRGGVHGRGETRRVVYYWPHRES